MGHYKRFTCHSCQYDTERLAVGIGRDKSMELLLYRCPNCKSIGSAWKGGERPVMCQYCYHEELELLPDEQTSIACPKCETPGLIASPDGRWE